jgi:hypothetical protein
LVIVPRRLRAPRQDGAVVAEPPLDEAAALLAANRRLRARPGPDILGRPWGDLAQAARRAAVAAAREYHRRAGEPIASGDDTSLVMAGHQPELFHPGVWVKNFALAGLAAAGGGTAVNLVVDNDTAKSTVLHLPALAGADAPWPHAASVPFDHWTGEVPYEERHVRDETLFASLSERAAPYTEGWGFEPLLPAYWAEVRRQAERTPLLGERLAAARRTLERHWGCHNLELPVSCLCRTKPFAWFAGHLLTELPLFHRVYNDSVREYRKLYGIRSRNHPVPELAKEGDWLEAPFWAWRAGAARRGRLLVRRQDDRLELRIGSEAWPTLPLGRDAAALIGAWQELERQGLKVRSRALTNTLFARLFLADLFVHGIGGGKYDELTDAIIRRFYAVEPPGYLVLSATLLLPLPTYAATSADRCRLARALRDLRHNPQRHLDGATVSPTAQDLNARKEDWISRLPANARERRERFLALRELTEQLRPWVVRAADQIEQEMARSTHELEANAVLKRRDYAFCLYPESRLRSFCTEFLAR